MGLAINPLSFATMLQPVPGVQRLQILWNEMGEVSPRSKDLESETRKVTAN